MENLKRFFMKDNFIVNSGIELLDVSPGYAKAKMDIEEKHLRNDENIISIFLSPILSLMVIWGDGIIEPFPK